MHCATDGGLKLDAFLSVGDARGKLVTGHDLLRQLAKLEVKDLSRPIPSSAL